MIKTYLLPSLPNAGYAPPPPLNCCFSNVGEQVCVGCNFSRLPVCTCAIMETVTLLSEYFHPSVINVYLWISLFSLSQSQSHLPQPSWVMKHASSLHGNATPTLTIYYPEALSPPSPGIYYKTIGKLSSRGHLLPLPLPRPQTTSSPMQWDTTNF